MHSGDRDIVESSLSSSAVDPTYQTLHDFGGIRRLRNPGRYRLAAIVALCTFLYVTIPGVAFEVAQRADPFASPVYTEVTRPLPPALHTIKGPVVTTGVGTSSPTDIFHLISSEGRSIDIHTSYFICRSYSKFKICVDGYQNACVVRPNSNSTLKIITAHQLIINKDVFAHTILVTDVCENKRKLISRS